MPVVIGAQGKLKMCQSTNYNKKQLKPRADSTDN